jgi:hypothetical protein
LRAQQLPLFLDAIVPPWLAIILSVSLVLFFGEIVPSALFTGPQQLRIAARFSPGVRCAIFPLHSEGAARGELRRAGELSAHGQEQGEGSARRHIVGFLVCED